MKKILLILLFFTTAFFNAQSKDSEKETSRFISNLTVKLGFNVIDANKYKKGKYLDNVFMSQDNGARYGIPLKLDLEYRFHKVFGFEISGSSNKWKAGKAVIDGRNIADDQNYLSLDANLKFYFDDAVNHLIGGDWLELYASGGVGYFEIGDFSNGGAFSVNLGTGITAWVSDHFGVNFNAVIKLSERDYSEYGYWEQTLPQRGYVRIGAYDPSHTQYSLGIAYRFDNNDKDNDGVYDLNDDCPNIPGPKKRNGCPDDGSLSKRDKEKNLINSAAKTETDINTLANAGEIKKPKEDVVILDQDSDGVANAKDMFSDALSVLTKKVKFRSGRSNFTQNGYPVMQPIIDLMKQRPNTKYRILGHTDNVGSLESNEVLGEKRANRIKKHLIDNGMLASNLQSFSLGEANPIDSNLTEEGRSNNRRIQIIVIN